VTELVFDIETDGLLRQLSRVHCISTESANGGDNLLYEPENVEDGLRALMKADAIVAHNGINFDVPAIQKVYPWFKFTGEVHDTLVYTRLLWPNIGATDAGRVAAYKRSDGRSGLPPKLIGSHSLEAWGYRLKIYKGEFGKDTDWQTYTPEMGSYCRQDVAVNVALWQRIKEELAKRDVPDLAITLEHQAAWLLAQQERNGFKFNEAAAIQLYAELVEKRELIKQKLVDKYGSWYVANGITTPKRTVKYKDKLKGDLTEGKPYTKIKLVTFNPASRQHVARVLIRGGWKPKEFTPSGQPKIDETILENLGTPDALAINEYFLLNKRIGQIAEGEQAWLNHVTPQGFIHGFCNPNGAATRRATHAFPNIAQVPSTKALYGAECRDLFTVPEGWQLLGSDASGLELRCLGHYMAKYDGGAYIKVVLEGDIHWENAQAAGFIPKGTVRDKHNEEHEAARNAAKRFIYAFLYGAGDELIGELVGYTEAEYLAWKANDAHVPVINSLKHRGETITRERVCHFIKGAEVKKRFLKGLPALNSLIKDCKATVRNEGHVIGLDGYPIKAKSEHAALNYQLQSAGALICKLWIVLIDKKMRELGYKHGWDGDYAFSAWVHDEVQVGVRSTEVGEALGQVCIEAMKETEKTFKFRCPLDAEWDLGSSWRYTH
jgi:DNA polymerase-1